VSSEVEAMRRSLVEELCALEKPGGNLALQSYLGSPYPMLGLSTPQMRGILHDFTKNHHDLGVRALNSLADSLWKGRTTEEKSLAIELLNMFHAILDEESWRMLDKWIEEAIGWALCDSLGSGPISAMLCEDKGRFHEAMKWTRAKNYWRRRISTYALKDMVHSHDLDKPFKLLERLLYDKEFWVQRAVGTWLRECWKKDRKRTESFLLHHVRGMPRVTITVATERAPKSFRQKLRRMR